MPVSSYHVGGHQDSVERLYGVQNCVKQVFQLHHMVQRLVRHDGVVRFCGTPLIEIPLQRENVPLHSMLYCEIPPARQHGGI